jgi:adenylate kinase
VKRAEHSSALPVFGSPKAKIILLGPSGPLHAAVVAQARSFSIEHVSPALLVQQEISRRTSPGRQAGAALSRGPAALDLITLALLRKWFWARKPDAGFVLTDFPATLLQALVFDEWLEARGESLTAVLAADPHSADPVATHYRTQGLLTGGLRAAA